MVAIIELQAVQQVTFVSGRDAGGLGGGAATFASTTSTSSAGMMAGTVASAPHLGQRICLPTADSGAASLVPQEHGTTSDAMAHFPHADFKR